MTQVSVIICTYNNAKSLSYTLEALGQVYVPEHINAELIVVDNGSIDNTAALTKSFHLPNMTIRYIYEPNRGISYARNNMLFMAKGKIIILIDDDIRPHKTWLEAICAPLIKSEADVALGKVILPKYLERPWLKKYHNGLLAVHDSQTYKESYPNLSIIGANLAFSQHILKKIPFFDTELGPGTNLGTADDSLFGWQLHAAGFKMIFVPEAIVEHYFDSSRLNRASLMLRINKSGRSMAYIQYHWEHKTITHIYFRIFYAILRLFYYYFRYGFVILKSRVASWEISLWYEISFLKQYLKEAKRPRSYEKHGLIKLDYRKG